MALLVRSVRPPDEKFDLLDTERMALSMGVRPLPLNQDEGEYWIPDRASSASA